jgi:hypothetical protein
MTQAVFSARRLWSAVLAGVCLALFSVSPIFAITSEYQQCPVDSSCVVGEFLLNDDYTPSTGATCTYTARKPDGTLFLNAVSMTGQSDGWYAYTVNTTSAVEGLYRGTVCCTPTGEEQVCLERSFQVGPADLTSQDVENAVWDAETADHTTDGTFGENLQAPSSLSAADIWSYPSRSLTTFGSLVSDIWANSSRSLTGFGDLVSSIWGADSRTITDEDLADGEFLATTTNISGGSTTITQNVTFNTISQQLAETHTLLEQLINEPIIETFIEDTPSESLESKVQYTNRLLTQLHDHVTRASNAVDILILTWNSVDQEKLSNELASTVQLLGRTIEQPQPETVLDETQDLADVWDNYIITSLSDQAKAALVSARTTQSELKIAGKANSTRQSLEETSKFVTMLQKLVGTTEDTYTNPTAFGFLRDTERKVEALRQQRQSVEGLLGSWSETDEAQRGQLLATLSKEVSGINAVPSAQAITTPMKDAKSPELRQKNTAYGLKALITANERLLAKNPNSLMNLLWFEEGSVVFRFLVTNPSTTTTQQVPIAYPLPEEIERQHILEVDPLLRVAYDPLKSTYVLTGTITLDPEESKNFAVEVEDVWTITPEELESLRTESESLHTVLQRTDFAKQADDLYEEIQTSFASIKDNQNGNASPDVRIKTYRKNQLSVVEIKQKLATLNSLATSSAATSTVFGFVGGIQVLLVWGMIIILMAGFIYLALYTHAVHFGKKHEKPDSHHITKQTPSMPVWKRLLFALFLSTITTTTTASVGSAFMANTTFEQSKALAAKEYPTVLGTTVTNPQKSILKGTTAAVSVFASPSETAEIYHKIPEDIFVTIKAKSKNWVQIQYIWGGMVHFGWVQESQIKLLEN